MSNPDELPARDQSLGCWHPSRGTGQRWWTPHLERGEQRGRWEVSCWICRLTEARLYRMWQVRQVDRKDYLGFYRWQECTKFVVNIVAQERRRMTRMINFLIDCLSIWTCEGRTTLNTHILVIKKACSRLTWSDVPTRGRDGLSIIAWPPLCTCKSPPISWWEKRERERESRPLIDTFRPSDSFLCDNFSS